MRKAIFLFLVLVFGAISVNAKETYAQCVKKCKSDEKCLTCCENKLVATQRECAEAALDAAAKCQAAAKTDKDKEKCNSTFMHQFFKVCGSENHDITNAKFICGVPTPK